MSATLASPVREGAARATRAARIGMVSAVVLALWLAAGPARAADPAPPAPRTTEISYFYDLFDHSLVRPMTRMLDPALGVRKLSGHPAEASNVDADDQVRLPSTWWQPRVGFRPVSVEQLLNGPGSGSGPASGIWTVTRAKTQGVTPGFFITDAHGDKFIIKFDPPHCAEMATGADVVASYLFWGAGYNAPDNAVVFFRPESLALSTKATYVDMAGKKRPMSQDYLTGILGKLPRRADGTIRGIASRLLPGHPLGPFEYRGRRRDDPEDLIPHQNRRELRGLWVMAAWTNHADARGPNSLDMWVHEDGRWFVRHHLIDFGSCLGSGALAARAPQTGGEYFVDYGRMAHSLVTLGLQPARWESTVDPGYPSIGFIDSKAFDPVSWRPDYPNPAFDERTARDVRWGVRIVGSFTDEQIRAAVARGRYDDPRAAEYLARILIERRDKLVARWLPEMKSGGAKQP